MSRYGDIADAMRERVRAAIRSGLTIDAIMARYDVPKRFVEDQRTVMLETEKIPDARCSTSGDAIRRMHKEGYTAREIAKTLQVSTAYVYQQRPKQK